MTVNQRVAIVEDHILFAETLAHALRGRDIEVLVATGESAAALVREVRRFQPGLALVDLGLGTTIGSGADLIAPLVDAGARVLIVTGITDRVRLAECLEQGASGFVNKTVPFDELLEAVLRTLDGERTLALPEREHLLAELRRDRDAEADKEAVLERLTQREAAVLTELMDGRAAETIAQRSFVAVSTVRTQIRAILRKLEVNSQVAAVSFAYRPSWARESATRRRAEAQSL